MSKNPSFNFTSEPVRSQISIRLSGMWMASRRFGQQDIAVLFHVDWF